MRARGLRIEAQPITVLSMVSRFGDSFALLALIALLPGVISWWSGRKLLALADDPILPERMIANRRRTGLSFLIAFAGLASLSPWSLFWTAPLVFLSAHVAAYPVRRAIFGETWGLGAYLSFFARMLLGLFGFWALLIGLPGLTRFAGRADWVAGIGLAAVLLFWNARYAEVVRYCLRARPMEEGDLLSRFRELADRCGLPRPRFEMIQISGGVVANALALPSLRTSSVLFTDTLIARLDREEAEAICAHELAHLEYYNTQRMRQINRVTIAVIVAGSLWTPAVRLAGLQASWFPVLLWLSILMGALMMRAKGKQHQESVCDARAVALTGGAEPLIGALTKLYTIARIPRRVELRYEQSGSHPSLARRIKDIRKAAGSAPADLASTAVFVGANGRTTVTFDPGRLHLTGADAVTHSIDYANLCELRIDVSRSPRLVARGTQAGAWEVELNAGDAARVQVVLDLIDSRLGEPVKAPAVPQKHSRHIVGVLALMSFMFWQVAVALLALFACIRLVTPLLVAAGLAALTNAGLALRDGPEDFALMMAVPGAIIGIVLLVLAWMHRREPHGRIGGFVAAIATLALLATASVSLTGLDVVRLHQAVRVTPSAIVLLTALAGALACSQVRLTQLSGLAVAIMSITVSVVGSPAFLDRFGRDPFLVDGPAIEWLAVDDAVIEEFAVPIATSRIRLSPDGRRIAALAQSHVPQNTSTFHVGRAGEDLVPLAGDDLIFLDSEHVLVTDVDLAGTSLRKVSLNNGREAVWTQRVEGMLGATLTVDRRSQRWRLSGWDQHRGLFRAEGVIGSSPVDERRWPMDQSSDPAISGFTTVGSRALVVETRYDGGLFQKFMPPRWSGLLLLLQPYTQESHYWTLDAGGRTELGVSRLGTDCWAGLVATDALVCGVFDGTRTRFISLDAAGSIAAIGWLPGRFTSDRNTVPDWITGWSESTAAAIRLSTRQALRLPQAAHAIGHLAIAGDRLAAVTYSEHGPRVRTYAVDRVSGREAMRQ